MRSFRVANNDRLLIVYLSSLIRSVIALHALVNNRLEMARGEHSTTTAPASHQQDEEHVKT